MAVNSKAKRLVLSWAIQVYLSAARKIRPVNQNGCGGTLRFWGNMSSQLNQPPPTITKIAKLREWA